MRNLLGIQEAFVIPNSEDCLNHTGRNAESSGNGTNTYDGDKGIIADGTNAYDGDKGIIADGTNACDGDKGIIADGTNVYAGDKGIIADGTNVYDGDKEVSVVILFIVTGVQRFGSFLFTKMQSPMMTASSSPRRMRT